MLVSIFLGFLSTAQAADWIKEDVHSYFPLNTHNLRQDHFLSLLKGEECFLNTGEKVNLFFFG